MVNTFLPYSDFKLSAKVLDNKRLGKQRVEAQQIITLLQDYDFLMFTLGIKRESYESVGELFKRIKKTYVALDFKYCRVGYNYFMPNDVKGQEYKEVKLGFGSHPAVKMWFGYIDALRYYTNCMIYEWVGRGFKNTMPIYYFPTKDGSNDVFLDAPHWLGNSNFHLSHQSNLLRKDAKYYEKAFNSMSADWEYCWPVD